MTREDILSKLQKITSAEEETFLLYSQQIPSQNLGYVDAQATSLDVTIAGRDFTISQSPKIFTSNRSAGTTGSVLWKITPLIAEWLCFEGNFLCTGGTLTKDSTVLELGCGISGLVALSLAPHIRRYIATDQSYVLKLLNKNVEANATARDVVRKKKQRASGKALASDHAGIGSIQCVPLDWELDDPSNLLSIIGEHSAASGATSRDAHPGIDLIIACDCVYNEALVAPLIRTSAEICRLRRSSISELDPTICIIAHQLRSSDTMEAFLNEIMELFDVWRVPDELLIDGLKENSGFVVHIAVLRNNER